VLIFLAGSDPRPHFFRPARKQSQGQLQNQQVILRARLCPWLRIWPVSPVSQHRRRARKATSSLLQTCSLLFPLAARLTRSPQPLARRRQFAGRSFALSAKFALAQLCSCPKVRSCPTWAVRSSSCSLHLFPTAPHPLQWATALQPPHCNHRANQRANHCTNQRAAQPPALVLEDDGLQANGRPPSACDFGAANAKQRTRGGRKFIVGGTCQQQIALPLSVQPAAAANHHRAPRGRPFPVGSPLRPVRLLPQPLAVPGQRTSARRKPLANFGELGRRIWPANLDGLSCGLVQARPHDNRNDERPLAQPLAPSQRGNSPAGPLATRSLWSSALGPKIGPQLGPRGGAGGGSAGQAAVTRRAEVPPGGGGDKLRPGNPIETKRIGRN